MHVVVNFRDTKKDHLAGIPFSKSAMGISQILQLHTSLFGHGALRHGACVPGHGHFHTSSVLCPSTQELSPRPPFQADPDGELCPSMAQLCSHSSDKLDLEVNRDQIRAQALCENTLTAHSHQASFSVPCADVPPTQILTCTQESLAPNHAGARQPPLTRHMPCFMSS